MPGTEPPSKAAFFMPHSAYSLHFQAPHTSQAHSLPLGHQLPFPAPFLSLCFLDAPGGSLTLSLAVYETQVLLSLGQGGPVGSCARSQKTGCPHSATHLCVTADLLFPFCKMGAQASGNPDGQPATGASDLSPAKGFHQGDIRRKDSVLCPLLGVKLREDRSLALWVALCRAHSSAPYVCVEWPMIGSAPGTQTVTTAQVRTAAVAGRVYF